MKKILVLLLVVAIGFALTACADEVVAPTVQPTEEQTAGEQTTDQQPESQQNITTTELTVWGMTCNRCVNDVKRVVSALEGVIDVSVNFRDETVTVEHDSELDIDTIKSTIEAEGYNVA